MSVLPTSQSSRQKAATSVYKAPTPFSSTPVLWTSHKQGVWMLIPSTKEKEVQEKKGLHVSFPGYKGQKLII